MTANPEKRPNCVELCQIMVPGSDATHGQVEREEPEVDD